MSTNSFSFVHCFRTSEREKGKTRYTIFVMCASFLKIVRNTNESLKLFTNQMKSHFRMKIVFLFCFIEYQQIIGRIMSINEKMFFSFCARKH